MGGPLVLDDDTLIMQAALDSVGLAFVFERLIETGRPVRVLAEWWPGVPGVLPLFPGRRQMPAVLRAFINTVRT